MAFSFAAASSSLSSSSSPLSSFSPLLHLPAVLLPHVCSFLCPRELLGKLARTARAMRDQLSPACFSFYVVDLDFEELLYLAARTARSSFYARVLSESHLHLHLSSPHIGMQQVLASLHHFPSCSSVAVIADGWKALRDEGLHNLLHHPTVLSCKELSLQFLERSQSEPFPVSGSQPQSDVRITRSKRRRDSDSAVAVVTTARKQRFSWANIRLPSVTQLRLNLHGRPCYFGGLAFLRAHPALVELTVSMLLVSLPQLTRIFSDPHALPLLARFTLHEHNRQRLTTHDVRPMLTALASTAVEVSGRPRPMRSLEIHIATQQGVFAAAALMPELHCLRVYQVRPPWLDEWTPMPDRQLVAFPQLQACLVHVNVYDNTAPPTDMVSFLESMATCPLQTLQLRTGQPVTFDAAAIGQLARLDKLEELSFSIGTADIVGWVDWTDPALFAAFTSAPGCLRCLQSVLLRNVKLSADSILAIGSAMPNLKEFILSCCQLSCHPVIVAAIIGGCCERIESVDVGDRLLFDWTEVRAKDVVEAHRNGVAAAGRDEGCSSFTQLAQLRLDMCWCTPASVWYALLSLLKCAQVECVAALASNDPLVVAALSCIPSVSQLSSECLWPNEFATFMEQKDERTGRYRYLQSRRLSGAESSGCPGERAVFELSDSATDDSSDLRPVRLRPRSDLFTAFQRSLSDEQQAVLTRWAASDFRPDDEQLRGVEGPERSEIMEDEGDKVDHRHCPHPHDFSYRYEAEGEEPETAYEAALAAVDGGRSRPDDEEKIAD